MTATTPTAARLPAARLRTAAASGTVAGMWRVSSKDGKRWAQYDERLPGLVDGDADTAGLLRCYRGEPFEVAPMSGVLYEGGNGANDPTAWFLLARGILGAQARVTGRAPEPKLTRLAPLRADVPR